MFALSNYVFNFFNLAFCIFLLPVQPLTINPIKRIIYDKNYWHQTDDQDQTSESSSTPCHRVSSSAKTVAFFISLKWVHLLPQLTALDMRSISLFFAYLHSGAEPSGMLPDNSFMVIRVRLTLWTVNIKISIEVFYLNLKFWTDIISRFYHFYSVIDIKSEQVFVR